MKTSNLEKYNVCQVLILGLMFILDNCESRAANVSNTWTLPQQEFSVFYRFFRDKISWFEADAVCQFHHSNLVTVDNSMQFDAARNFLKVLDVNQPVWIGLMRPQNSQIFAWSNSKQLASFSGYWAESLPLMESPLCAVIDPLRDFRWHALRCGGPETASFLCEINAPNWARECIPVGIPSTIVQYIADSGTVEITKDCGNEDVIKRVCRSKEDLMKIIKELICKNEDILNVKTNLTGASFNSLKFITNVSSDNNEDNNINIDFKKPNEKVKNEGENSIGKLIEQFNVEDIGQADQPQINLKDELTTTSKKDERKAKINEEKSKSITKTKVRGKKNKAIYLSDMMMGDQAVAETEETQEPLPHIKKSLPQDLKHHGTTEESTIITNTLKPEEVISPIEESNLTVSPTVLTFSVLENKTRSIQHPMHTQHVHVSTLNSLTIDDEVSKHSFNKENSDSHFIPPMLLVKSHYTSTKSHFDEQSIAISSDKVDVTTHGVQSVSEGMPTVSTLYSEQIQVRVPVPVLMTEDSPVLSDRSNSGSETILSTSSPALSPTSSDHQTVELKFKNFDNQTIYSITTRTIPIDMETVTTKLNENRHEQYYTQPLHGLLLTTVAENDKEAKSSSQNEEIVPTKMHNKFSNEENFQPYKPNRRRILTKPEPTTFLKKILG